MYYQVLYYQPTYVYSTQYQPLYVQLHELANRMHLNVLLYNMQHGH